VGGGKNEGAVVKVLKKAAAFMKLLKSKKGQTSVEYIMTTAALFVAFVLFYKYYSWVVPRQFDQGAKVILAVYELK
jgi:uncharacterized protein (UPF0333 family)